MEDLEKEIKELIIETLNLEGFKTDDIETAGPLFGEGLGLDSIDALELGLALKKRFHIALIGESNDIRAKFYSVATLADYVRSQRGETI